jgi:alpha-beta hydrolase superfamily lysophospholipase
VSATPASAPPARTRYLDGGGPRLFVAELGAADATRTLVVIHGYAEHGGRYLKRLAPAAAAGWRVVLPDLRGHGRSDGPRGHVMRFAEYLDDVDRVLAAVGGEPDRTALLGHSNGGLVVASWLGEQRGRVACAALSSPLFGIALEAPAWKVAAGRFLSRVLPRISFPSEIKPDWVSRDPATVADYASDRLNHGVDNARWYTEAVAAMERAVATAPRIDVPLLVLQAGADRLVSPAAAARWASLVPHAEYDEIADAYHELLFDLGGEGHAARFLEWFDKHVPA